MREEQEEKKFSFRQRWFPSIDDGEELSKARGNDNSYGVMQALGRWTRSLVLITTLIWGTYQGIGNNIQYSEGTRTGMINKIAKKGLFWKTYEGQMALEGIVSGKNYSGANIWDFSLDRQKRHGENTEELANKVRDYLESGTKVRVTYIEPFATWPWRSGTNYLIQSVDPIEKKE